MNYATMQQTLATFQDGLATSSQQLQKFLDGVNAADVKAATEMRDAIAIQQKELRVRQGEADSALEIQFTIIRDLVGAEFNTLSDTMSGLMIQLDEFIATQLPPVPDQRPTLPSVRNPTTGN